MEIRRGVLNRAKSSVVCNASATNFLLTTDFSGIFGYPNVNIQIVYPGSFGSRDF